MNQKMGLLGRKLGMTQLFEEDGTVIPVTAILVGPNHVLQVKAATGRDGYNALQLGFGSQKEQRLTKPERGHFQKVGVAPTRLVKEIRVTAEDAAKYTAGQELNATDVFEAGQRVDVVGISKGRGFSGVMKRHHFRGFERTHGAHEYFRHGGSIGTRLTPGHVLKGKKMAGHLGAAQVTVQNLDVVRVDAEMNVIFLRGGVPGPMGAHVTVRHTVKGG